MNIQRRRGFTLIEMLIVIAIIAILAALIFPSFSAAREDARQKSCSSNLREIGLAVQMYRVEEREYPMSLGALLPPSVKLNNVDGSTLTPPVIAIDGVSTDCNATGTPTANCTNTGGTGYLRDVKYLTCPDDRISSTQPRSSYGDLSTGVSPAGVVPNDMTELSRRTWNFWGLRDDGVALNNQAAAQAANGGNAQPAPATLNVFLVNPSQKYVAPDTLPGNPPALADYRTNVVKNSLSNRFAPSSTIITYCPFHRPYSSSVSNPEKLYDATEIGRTSGARDLILRVDGTVKSVVVSSWRSAGAVDTTLPADPNYKMWQLQTFR